MELEDQIAALTVLQSRIKAVIDKKRKEWFDKARPKSRATAMLGDEELGSVSWRKGSERWTLTDRAALMQWALEHAPHLVDYAPHIPENHLAALKKNPVTEDGEVVPGFEMSESDPGVAVRVAKDADEIVARAVQSGALTYSELLELEA